MGTGLPNCWTDDIVEALRIGVDSDLSFSQIAADLNSRFGTFLSRNACIGKAKRAGFDRPGIKPRSTPRKYVRKARTNPGPLIQSIKSKIASPELPFEQFIEAVLEIPVLDIGLHDLTDSNCHFPTIRKNDEWRFCGLFAPDGPYCCHHQTICYVPPKQRQASSLNEERAAA